ncbi:MAG: polysaccharide pyruvyl transferase CsaB [Firmicutes bacterium]|nr:polysaccharide pyruvyl transferase CsaB [Bacillota bacterium]
MNKKVVLSGYYGFNNLGDEAVLFSILQSLRQVVPDIEITVLSNDPTATAREYGVTAVDRWNMGAVAGALRDSRLLISGGGSLLQDVTGPRSLLYYLGIIWLARLLRRPVLYYSQGIGPVNAGWGRRLTGLTTRGVRAVTVRDEESAADLLAMGVRRAPEVTADPVLGLDPAAIDRAVGARVLKQHDITPGSLLVGVAVRSLPAPPADWAAQLAGALDLLVRAGRAVVFVPMQRPPDVSAAREVAALMREKRVIIGEPLTVVQMVSLVANLDLLLGMRLHALIFAAVMGTPPLGIVYDPKVERFLRRIGLTPAGTPEQLRSAPLAAMAETCLSDREKLAAQIAPLLDELRMAARRPAEIVRAILEKKM